MTKTHFGHLRRPPKIHQNKYEFRFKPPAVKLAEGVFLVPIVHTNEKKIRSLRRRLDDSTFYVKAIDKSPERVPGGHSIMIKIRRREPTEGLRPNSSSLPCGGGRRG
jgi:hypothetical protein